VEKAGAAFETSRQNSPANIDGMRWRPHSGVDDRPGIYCLIFKCVTPTVSHPAWYRRNKQCTSRVSIDAWPDTRMGVTKANPPIARPMQRNYGAKKMTVLNVGRFVRSGVGHCPEIPHIVVRVGVPERHIRSMSVANASVWLWFAAIKPALTLVLIFICPFFLWMLTLKH